MPPIMSIGKWTWSVNLERAIVVANIAARIAGISLLPGFVKMYTRRPRNTIAKVVWPDGNELVVS